MSLAAMALAACASVDPRPDYEKARDEIRATTGEDAVHDPRTPVLSDAEIGAVLADGLSAAEATRVALLNNRRLHAGFLTLGLSRAEFVQAGLLQNPSLSLAFLIPDAGGRVRWTADLVQSVADIWQLPARRALAQAGIERDVLNLSRFAGELVAETSQAYFESVAAQQSRSVAQEGLDLARRSFDGVRRQVEEGVASSIDVGLAESSLLAAEITLQRSEIAEAAATRELAALLSLRQDIRSIDFIDELPQQAPPKLEREALVVASLHARLDLRAAERAVVAASRRVDLERRRRSPELSAGLTAERPEGGGSADLFLGPAATIEVPVFDQNLAQLSRAEFELAMREKELEALEVEVGQGVRAAYDKVVVAAQAAGFAREQLRPQAEHNASLAQRAYALGDTTVLTLLKAQESVLEARRTEIELALDAVLSRIELERSTGSRLETL